ncbi:MAG: phytase [Oligoflexales bacterium]|nr:phytase [Oligoflexales bacterium]
MLANKVARLGVLYGVFLFHGATYARFEVQPSGETQPVGHRGDAIDDPALWVNPDNPQESLILGTDKQQGINVYSLSGKLLFSYGKSRFNNIDIRYNFPDKGDLINLIAATRHDISQVEFFSLDYVNQKLAPLNYHIKPSVKAYGLCLYHDQERNNFHLFVTGRDRNAQQFQIIGGDNGLSHIRERIIPVASKNEGCVADDERGFVYIAEEHKGIWKLPTDASGLSKPRLIGSIAGNDDLEDDIEGLALYIGENGEGYLIASVQGLDSFAIFDRKTDRYLDSFQIVSNGRIDGVSHTDGIEVISSNLGWPYDQGLMIAQDDEDGILPRKGTQNFKLVPWRDISEAISLSFEAGH